MRTDVDPGRSGIRVHGAPERLTLAGAEVVLHRGLFGGPEADAHLAGLLDEDAGDFASARARYEASLGNAPPGALRDQIESRLDFVRVEELRADVRASLAREAELRQTTPDP